MELQEINKKLEQLPAEIENKTQEVIQSNEDYARAKATWEYKMSEIYLNVKAINPDATQGDLTANSKIGSHVQRLDMISKQSAWKKKVKELQRLRDDYDALLECSYNYRASLKRFNA